MEEKRKYYAAYDERYKTAHAHGVSWAGEMPTPIVRKMLEQYEMDKQSTLLEIGCGEGRDAKVVLEEGYSLLATDISREAITYCRKMYPEYSARFRVLDCLCDTLDAKFDFIYAVAVVHMLVLDADRDGFYQFVRTHLSPNGVALICTMGDGEFEMKSDISTAFTLQERAHEAGKLLVAGTSCRMVSFATFEAELARNRLRVLERGITEAPSNFNSLMYAVVCAEE